MVVKKKHKINEKKNNIFNAFCFCLQNICFLLHSIFVCRENLHLLLKITEILFAPPHIIYAKFHWGM